MNILRKVDKEPIRLFFLFPKQIQKHIAVEVVRVARQRSPDREKAKEMYLKSKGEAVLKDIAEQLGLKDSQIRKWKSQDKWDDELKGALLKTKGNATNQKDKVTPKKEKEIMKELEEADLTEKQRLFCLYYVRNFNATQAYLKAYQCSYDVANAEGYKFLVKPCIKKEIERLKEIKRQSIMLTEDDLVELHMRIVFAHMTDFAEFGQEEVPVMNMFGPIEIEDKETGKKTMLTKIVNVVRFKDSSMVDGGIIREIKQGKDGASIKLEDRQKSSDWLMNYFNMNPMSKHKQEFDKHKMMMDEERLALEKIKINGEEGETEDDGFIEALSGEVSEVWDDAGED